jgi:hypothetical protein
MLAERRSRRKSISLTAPALSTAVDGGTDRRDGLMILVSVLKGFL